VSQECSLKVTGMEGIERSLNSTHPCKQSRGSLWKKPFLLQEDGEGKRRIGGIHMFVRDSRKGRGNCIRPTRARLGQGETWDKNHPKVTVGGERASSRTMWEKTTPNQKK